MTAPDPPSAARTAPASDETALGLAEGELAADARGPLRLGLLVLGALLLAGLVRQVGSDDLLGRLVALGPRAPLLLWPFALIALIDAAAWSFTLARSAARPSIAALAMIRLAGESVNNLTPTAYLGGEPVKAMLLVERGVAVADGGVSVVVAKTALIAGQVVFVLLGTALALERFGIVRRADLLLAALATLAALFLALLVRVQRRHPFGRLHRLAVRLGMRGPRVDRLGDLAPRLDEELDAFYATRSGDFARSSVVHLVGWIAGALEVKVFGDLVRYPIGWRDAFVIESISQPLSLGAVLVPGALGLREAGGVGIFRLLGLDESAGLAVWLLRRLREVVYSGLGLAFLFAASRRRIPR